MEDYVGFDNILQPNKESSEKPDQPEDMEELAKDLQEKFIEAWEARSQYENDWEFFRLYTKGEQLIARNRDTGETIRISEEDSKRLRSMWNVLRPTVRSLIGKLARTVPTCKVLPASAVIDEHIVTKHLPL